ncbi:helix-turn-helix domain-containing protein [Streptomyces sp. A012304]|uniref:AraC-like ligand-binding domain-containing protein n=1 Tax=Streptomyces sp. A012304 TaxID=375446 RepID=UPI0022305B46|nr:helix-turn-helix domain-containing protein [Streptomyces sp. A012304]GKQ40567.1 AraC family transcriptional regulator [Streptomyces sp. A012304]
MNVTEFRTDRYPTAERFIRWRDKLVEELVPTVVRSDEADDFRASARLLDLGPVRLSALTHPSVEVCRTSRLVRQSDTERCLLLLNLRGSQRVVLGSLDTTIGPGEMVLVDTWHPWRCWARARDGAVEALWLRVPRALLPLPIDKINQLAAVRLPGGQGLGVLLSGYLQQLLAGAAAYRATDGAGLATVTVDLLTAWCVHHLDAEARLTPEAHQRVLLQRIHDFIDSRLGDPGLCPTAIASAHQISTRYLHRLFQGQGMTVVGRIRQLRLERCHRDLGNPQLGSRPIHVIAARWGFTDAAHFSRTFRAAYGMPPRDYRCLVHHGRGGHASSSTGHGPTTTRASSRSRLGTERIA